MGVHYLVFQQIFLVEKKNDRGVLEPGVGDYGPKKGFALLHPVLSEETEFLDLMDTTGKEKIHG